MALAESINIRVENNLTTLLNPTQDYMLIGGVASNLLSTDGYLTIRPFLFNAKIEQGNPWQLQTKVFLNSGSKMDCLVSDVPINLIWDSDGINNWDSDNVEGWNSPSPGYGSTLLNLTVAAI